jgi:hypothetical protein
MLSDEHALGGMLLEYFPGYGTAVLWEVFVFINK